MSVISLARHRTPAPFDQFEYHEQRCSTGGRSLRAAVDNRSHTGTAHESPPSRTSTALQKQQLSTRFSSKRNKTFALSRALTFTNSHSESRRAWAQLSCPMLKKKKQAAKKERELGRTKLPFAQAFTLYPRCNSWVCRLNVEQHPTNHSTSALYQLVFRTHVP